MNSIGEWSDSELEGGVAELARGWRAWVEVEDRRAATMLKSVDLSEPVIGVILSVH